MSGQQVTELAGKMFLVLLILYVLSNPVGALFWVFCIILLFAGVFGLLYLFCIVASWIERLRARYLASHPEVAVRKKKAVIQKKRLVLRRLGEMCRKIPGGEEAGTRFVTVSEQESGNWQSLIREACGQLAELYDAAHPESGTSLEGYLSLCSADLQKKYHQPVSRVSSGNLSDGKKQELLKEVKIKAGEGLYEREYGRFPFPLHCRCAEICQPPEPAPVKPTPKPASGCAASGNDDFLGDFEEYLFVKDHNPLK